jgi:hypothetical protein
MKTLKKLFARILSRSNVCVTFCGLLCASCGIFSPRPVEYPSTIVVDDPFNFASIMYNTGKTFTKLDYSDLFAGDPDGLNNVYSDIDGRQFSKKDLIAHLTTMQQTLSIKIATWKPDPQTADYSFGDTMLILNRLYNVVASDSANRSLEFSSKASFTVVKNTTTNAWMILEWKDDYPVTDTSYSVFHPWYSPN